MLLPIGHYLGERYRPDSGATTHEVRRGATFHGLTLDEAKVWAIAHGSAEAVKNQLAWQRPSVVESAHAAGVADAGTIVDTLIGSGLLVELTPGADAALEFAKSHRLIPLMVGLGNAVDDPSTFEVGFLGRAVLQVNAVTYDLWQWSVMEDSLWGTCQSAADVARRSGSSPERADPELLLTGFLDSLHTLLVQNAACLDIDFRLSWPEAA